MKKLFPVLLIFLLGCASGSSTVKAPDGTRHSSRVYSLFSNSAMEQLDMERELQSTNFSFRSGVKVKDAQTSPETAALNIVASILAQTVAARGPGTGGGGGLSAEDVVKIIEASQQPAIPTPTPEPVEDE